MPCGVLWNDLISSYVERSIILSAWQHSRQSGLSEHLAYTLLQWTSIEVRGEQTEEMYTVTYDTLRYNTIPTLK
jgi:hypothetical protein